MIFDIDSEKELEDKCIVKLITSAWKSNRGAHLRKDIIFLRRKCIGYNILEEDCNNIGSDEVIPKIINLHEVPDGTYQVVVCNEYKDWETGYIDDYDYELKKI